MHRRDVLASAGLLAVASLAGCLGAPLQSRPDGPEAGGIPDTSNAPTVDDEAFEALIAGQTDFALDLNATLADTLGGNQFFSPYSISLVMSMIYAGADGQTAQEMESTLHLPTDVDVHETHHSLFGALSERETTVDRHEDEEIEAFKLDITNALWAEQHFPFSPEYVDLMDAHYGAGVYEADFIGAPEAERERINSWVAERTDDRIDELLSEDAIDADTRLVLTNAIAFMARWRHEFDPEETEPDTFTALDGSTREVPFMYQDIRTNHASFEGVEAIELPYIGNEVSMVLILPAEGTFESFEADLDADHLWSLFDALSTKTGELYLPHFEVESDLELGDLLETMGMPTAFSNAADFSGMHAEGARALKIDEVYHQAEVTVDEEGTEAAAATAGVMVPVSAPPSWGTIRIDRPFLFCIRDRPTDAVLFLGRVTDL